MGKLQEILGTEEGRKKLSALAGMLGQGEAFPSQAPPTASSREPAGEEEPDSLGRVLDDFLTEHPQEASQDGPAVPALAQTSQGGGFPGLDGLDLGMMMKLGSVLSKLNQKKDDKNTQLILALKPHLKPQRQKKADEAIRMLQMMDLLPLIKELNLFGEGSLLGK